MKTQKRTVVKAIDIQTAEQIEAIEVSKMIEGYEAKITSMYWSAVFDPFYKVWRKNGLQPLTRDEVLKRCGR